MNRPRRAKSSQPQKAHSNIRIIGGKHRGRKLPVLNAEGLRPTTDRVKETLFNWLMMSIHDSHCLDCFAGAGSLGFEAYSRGASSVTMLELNKDVAKQLQVNKQALSADTINVVTVDALQFLQAPNNKIDIAFVDPPFHQGLTQKTIDMLAAGWLAPGANVYVEQESQLVEPSVPESWQLIKEKTAGQVTYRLYEVE
ncbi:16S rRNA (guanine(966)-N(2))-methyltransferase RsmD [Thalassotalea euphylliae]|uniref:16S rRNA (guanine(966)-N(2))-methyltransferase RsmD n=1 Tax=Thalassotalea euphylliae TaxID=1655234 RepID=UPI00362F662D